MWCFVWWVCESSFYRIAFYRIASMAQELMTDLDGWSLPYSGVHGQILSATRGQNPRKKSSCKACLEGGTPELIRAQLKVKINVCKNGWSSTAGQGWQASKHLGNFPSENTFAQHTSKCLEWAIGKSYDTSRIASTPLSTKYNTLWQVRERCAASSLALNLNLLQASDCSTYLLYAVLPCMDVSAATIVMLRHVWLCF